MWVTPWLRRRRLQNAAVPAPRFKTIVLFCIGLIFCNGLMREFVMMATAAPTAPEKRKTPQRFFIRFLHPGFLGPGRVVGPIASTTGVSHAKDARVHTHRTAGGHLDHRPAHLHPPAGAGRGAEDRPADAKRHAGPRHPPGHGAL